MTGVSFKLSEDLKLKFDLALANHNLQRNENNQTSLKKQDILVHLIERFTDTILKDNTKMDTYYNQRCQTTVDNIMNAKINTN